MLANMIEDAVPCLLDIVFNLIVLALLSLPRYACLPSDLKASLAGNKSKGSTLVKKNDMTRRGTLAP